MNKAELLLLIQEVIMEELGGYYEKKPHIKKYRKSRFHPHEVEKRRQEKEKERQGNIFNISKVDNDVEQNVQPIDISNPTEMFLKNFLQSFQAKDEVARKILAGAPVGKKEVYQLAKRMVMIPKFPFQQPRKLAGMLMYISMQSNPEG